MYLLLCLLPAWVLSQPSSGFSLHHSLPLRAKHLSFVSENKNRNMRQMVLMKTSEYDALRHSYKLVQEASNMPSLVCLKQACLVHYSWPACISVPYTLVQYFHDTPCSFWRSKTHFTHLLCWYWAQTEFGRVQGRRRFPGCCVQHCVCGPSRGDEVFICHLDISHI